MARKLQYRDLLRQLKQNGVKIAVDSRKKDTNYTSKERAKIRYAYKKYKFVANDYHIKYYTDKKKADILASYGHIRQGDSVWLPRNGNEKNELEYISVGSIREGVEVTRWYEDGKKTTQKMPRDRGEFAAFAAAEFDRMPTGGSYTVQIGESGAWRNRSFGSLAEFEDYMPTFYRDVAKRDEKTRRQVQAEFEPIITFVETNIFWRKKRRKLKPRKK